MNEVYFSEIITTILLIKINVCLPLVANDVDALFRFEIDEDGLFFADCASILSRMGAVPIVIGKLMRIFLRQHGVTPITCRIYTQIDIIQSINNMMMKIFRKEKQL